MDIMDNIINQMIDFESEIHIQVYVDEKNAKGKTRKYLEKENRKIFERRSEKKAVFCPRLESTKKKKKRKRLHSYLQFHNFNFKTTFLWFGFHIWIRAKCTCTSVLSKSSKAKYDMDLQFMWGCSDRNIGEALAGLI